MDVDAYAPASSELPEYSPTLLKSFAMFGGDRVAIPTSATREKIIALQGRDPVNPLKFDIFKFWEAVKLTDPEMAKLAAIVLSAPATQVTVERAFSTLPLVITERRANIGPDLLNKLLTVKLNCLYNL